MSIANLASRPSAHKPIAPDIAAKLDEAEQRLASLEGEHEQIALDAALGADGAAARLAEHSALLADARQSAANMKVAYARAVALDETAARAARAALQRSQVNAVKAHLAARDKAAEALGDAIAEACKQWRILIERSEKAKAANPIGGGWPDSALCGLDEVKRAVENEIFRLGGDPSIHPRDTFPGGVALPGFQNQPDKIPPLAETLKAASAHTMKVLTGRQG